MNEFHPARVMRFGTFQNGRVVRDVDGVKVEDHELLQSLTVSRTTLQPGARTRGHAHPGKEEVYLFECGNATMQLGGGPDGGGALLQVACGDVVVVEDGLFHRVFNDGHKVVEFVCVFQKYDRGE